MVEAKFLGGPLDSLVAAAAAALRAAKKPSQRGFGNETAHVDSHAGERMRIEESHERKNTAIHGMCFTIKLIGLPSRFKLDEETPHDGNVHSPNI